jgi:hypothetical protein
MQHAHPPPGAAPSPLDHSFVLASLWPSLCTDDRRALRLCCSTMRDAVDAQAGSLEGQSESPVLSGTTVDRMVGVHTLTLSSMACLRRMLVGPPHSRLFPRLRSLRLRLVGAHGKRAAPCVRGHQGCVCPAAMQSAWLHACKRMGEKPPRLALSPSSANCRP